jgi:uncharacterized protein YjbI with pentapeptide repeats
VELRKISDEELKAILDRQLTWLTSGRTAGESARLDNLDLRGYDLRGRALMGADLSGSDMSGSDLSGASMAGANLSDANLDSATLRKTNLRGVDLTKTSLRNAQLNRADLSGANLRGVALSDAHLMEANLERADLGEAYLPGANLMETNLQEANLSGAELFQSRFTQSRLARANLKGAKLREANFEGADLSGADLTDCELIRAEFFNANLVGAQLERANLTGANFYKTDLSDANLRQATLAAARLIETDLRKTDLTGANVYGTSVWNIQLEDAVQKQLLVTPPNEAAVTVDDLEIAQFIYLLLSREKLRNVIETITSKAVLILGRFTPERKLVLDALAEELRTHDLVPIIFDFERSTNRDFTETIKTLAGLCFFVIADVTNPKSAPLELQATVPDYQIPFVTIIEEGEEPFSMFEDLARHDWVLKPIVTYSSLKILRQAFEKAILERAWEKHKELQKRKAQRTDTMSAAEFLNQ